MYQNFNYEYNFKGTLTPYIDAVIISHFHLDHCGALPYMSEQIGYDGPIFMTLPTKVIAPILLEDFRKVGGFLQRENYRQRYNMLI